jgi:hypothetical protein
MPGGRDGRGSGNFASPIAIASVAELVISLTHLILQTLQDWPLRWSVF